MRVVHYVLLGHSCCEYWMAGKAGIFGKRNKGYLVHPSRAKLAVAWLLQ